MSPTVVFDTNGLVSAALSSRSVSRQAFKKAYEQCWLLASNACLAELISVLHRPKFAKYITPFEVSFFSNRYILAVQIIPVTVILTDCRDEKDNKFLEVAVCGNATYLVSGDADLLVLHPYREIAVISPGDFLREDM